MKDIKIKDVNLVTNVTGNEKIPVSNGSGKPAAVTINQILEKVDLSNYATNDSVDLNNSNVLELLDRKANKSEIPTKVSLLLNDSNYITNKTITNFQYVTSSELTLVLDSINALTEGPVQDLIDNKADKLEIPIKLSLLENDKQIFMHPFDGNDVASSYASLLEALLKAGLIQYLNPKSCLVKAVKSDGSLVDVSNADTSCIAVSVKITGGIYDLEFWIMKKMYYPTSAFAFAEGINMYDTVCNDISLEKVTYGYRNMNLSDLPDITEWTKGALSDTNGLNNTYYISLDDTYLGGDRSVLDYLYKINNGELENYGHSDWYIPSIGLLAAIVLNVEEINECLNIIEGNIIETNDPYMAGIKYISSTILDSKNIYYIAVSGSLSYSVSADPRSNLYGNLIFIRNK